MSCSYFKIINDTGFCSASSDPHVPGIDEMGCLCFKDAYYACPIFLDWSENIDRHIQRFHDVRSANIAKN